MATQTSVTGQPAPSGPSWYARSPDEVTATLQVDPASRAHEASPC